MTSDYEMRTIKVSVLPVGKALFDEAATEIEIVDEAGGEFLEVSQGEKKVRFDELEWPNIRDAIEMMVKELRS